MLVELHQILKILSVIPESFALLYMIFLFSDIIYQSFSKPEGLYSGVHQGFYSLSLGYAGASGDKGTEVEHNLI